MVDIDNSSNYFESEKTLKTNTNLFKSIQYENQNRSTNDGIVFENELDGKSIVVPIKDIKINQVVTKKEIKNIWDQVVK